MRYYHVYATANDSKYYYRDIKNLVRIKKSLPGVTKVVLYISISLVKDLSILDRVFVSFIKLIFSKSSRFKLETTKFKSNIGRDFSSYHAMSNLIKKQANDEDFVFFQNRSGYGPFKNYWYRDFIDQFKKFDKTSICGSTISFRDHPSISKRVDLAHIQTYAFLTKVKFIKMLKSGFPGKEETSRLNIISKGEIELSQFFLKAGYGISCIEWPNEFVDLNSEPIILRDIRGEVTKNHQFYHKGYFVDKKNKYNKLKDFILTVVKGLMS